VERPHTSTITAEIKPRKEVISIEIRFKTKHRCRNLFILVKDKKDTINTTEGNIFISM
jgi:hypothetical protein